MIVMVRQLVNQQKGFTLIELIVVMGIMGILATIAVPTFQNYIRNQNLKTAARGITSDFFATREKALTAEKAPTEDSVRYRITFDQAGNSYTIARGAKLTGTTIYAYVDQQTKSMTSYAPYIKVDADQIVYFENRGTVTACNFTISNTNNLSSANIYVDFPSRIYATFTLQ